MDNQSNYRLALFVLSIIRFEGLNAPHDSGIQEIRDLTQRRQPDVIYGESICDVLPRNLDLFAEFRHGQVRRDDEIGQKPQVRVRRAVLYGSRIFDEHRWSRIPFEPGRLEVSFELVCRFLLSPMGIQRDDFYSAGAVADAKHPLDHAQFSVVVYCEHRAYGLTRLAQPLSELCLCNTPLMHDDTNEVEPAFRKGV